MARRFGARFLLAASRVRIGLAERRGRVGAWCVCSAASERASERERESRASLFCLAAAVSSTACRSSSRGLFGEGIGGRRGVGGLWWSVYLVCAQALFVVCAARVHCGRARLEGARWIGDAGRLVGAGALRRGWLAL